MTTPQADTHSFASQLANGARGVDRTVVDGFARPTHGRLTFRAPEPSPRLAACLGGGAR